MATRAHIRTVVLYHLVAGLDADVQADLAGVKAGYDGPVIASSDLARFCVDANADNGQVVSACD
jgi:hypothetical protein